MKAILSDYVALLPERDGLDALLPDLLRSMNIVPVSVAQIGVAQYGVDVAGVGPDPEDGVTKLFLFTVKKGNFTRTEWNTGDQAVRPSLDQLFDVYLPTHVEAAYRPLPKKVVLVFGGTLQQALQLEWAQYTQMRTQGGLAELTAWNGEHLADLIERHMLDELAVLGEPRRLLRKGLALLDVSDYDLSHMDRLFEQALQGGTSRLAHQRALRQINLAVRILFHEAQRVNVMRPAYHTAERAVLAVWAWMRSEGLLDDAAVMREFDKIAETLWQIGLAYAERLRPHCTVHEGLFGYGADELEYPLRTFEVLGELATIGLASVSSAKAGDTPGAMAAAAIAAEVISLIENNPSLMAPLYDDHAVDIALALLLLHVTGYNREAADWTVDLVERISVAKTSLGHHFPISHKDYRELVDLFVGRGDPEEAAPFSSILPLLAEWACILESPELYEAAKQASAGAFADTNLQQWYPDDTTESLLYVRDAKRGSGTTVASISLPEEMTEHRAAIDAARKYDEDASAFTFVQRERDWIGHVASRHHRTPVASAVWRDYLAEE